MIIWLASYPRSGNTYFRLLLKRCYGLLTYSVYDDEKDDPVIQNLHILKIKSKSIEEMAEDQQIYFVKTHELPQDNYPAIYLFRDGRDSLVSYAKFIESRNLTLYSSFEAILRDLITNDGYFGGWQRHILEWTQRNAPTAFIRFEDLISKNPIDILEKAYKELNLEVTKEINSNFSLNFAEFHHEFPNFFRKGKVDGWVEKFPIHLHYLFWKHHGEGMQAVGYLRKDDLLRKTLEKQNWLEKWFETVEEYEKMLQQQKEKIALQQQDLEAKEAVIQQFKKRSKTKVINPLPNNSSSIKSL